jgi:hypothetical protein
MPTSKRGLERQSYGWSRMSETAKRAAWSWLWLGPSPKESGQTLLGRFSRAIASLGYRQAATRDSTALTWQFPCCGLIGVPWKGSKVHRLSRLLVFLS